MVGVSTGGEGLGQHIRVTLLPHGVAKTLPLSGSVVDVRR